MNFQNDPTTSLTDLLHKTLDILAQQTALTARLLDQQLAQTSVQQKPQNQLLNQDPTEITTLINTQPGDPRPILELSVVGKPAEKDNETQLRSGIELSDPTEITTLTSKSGEGIVGPLRNQETASKTGEGIVGPLRNQETASKSGDGIVGPLRNHDVASKSGEGIVGPLRNHYTLDDDAQVTNKAGRPDVIAKTTDEASQTTANQAKTLK